MNEIDSRPAALLVFHGLTLPASVGRYVRGISYSARRYGEVKVLHEAYSGLRETINEGWCRVPVIISDRTNIWVNRRTIQLPL